MSRGVHALVPGSKQLFYLPSDTKCHYGSLDEYILKYER